MQDKELNMATVLSPARALEENKIRADLFYRLGVVVLEIPPLKNRRDDIPLLCQHFLAQWVARSRGTIHSDIRCRESRC